MEFRRRAGDDGLPPIIPPSSSGGYFPEQRSRGNLSANMRFNPEIMHGLGDFQDSIQRELEKEQIREDIIVAELTRRRILEAEVRKELIIEREIALRRAASANCLPLQERSIMKLDPRPNFMHQYFLDSRFLDDRFGFPSQGGPSDMIHPPLPSLSKFPGAVATEVTPCPESNGDRLLVLEKPDNSLSGVKQKAYSTPTAGKKRKASTPTGTAADNSSLVLTKRPKKEWRCVLCQVSATSEKGLKDHLNGKKHKAVEAETTGAMRHKDKTLPFAKRTADSTEVLENSTIADQEKGPKMKEECSQRESFVTTVEDMQDSCTKSDERLCQNSQHAEKSQKTNAEAVEEKLEKTAEFKMKKFWCGVCQVSAYSEKVMEDHKRGKKHRARANELNKSEEPSPAGTPPVSAKANRRGKDAKFWCDLCQIGTSSLKVMEGHRTGKRHLDKLEKAKRSEEASPATSTKVLAEAT